MFHMSLVGWGTPKDRVLHFFCIVFLGQGPVDCGFSICVSFGEQEPLTANFPAMISAKAAQKKTETMVGLVLRDVPRRLLIFNS